MRQYLLNSRDNITEDLINFHEEQLETYEDELHEALGIEEDEEEPYSLENVAIKILYLYDLDNGLL
ncbi:hypothetical protein AB832_07615 [Flavobacteriaceae bacterium (ex Bugula neritina AB1)]|nr:hypothetical protein AB832_07615 [Flavobacteriaceae bacterium (ex Bugula neritina AB1)]